jgi:Ca2+-binding RTX toxin-like protein
MATNMNQLIPEQQAVVNKIIAAGQQLGASNTVIMAAVNIANAESAFGPTKNNGASPTSKNYAFGLYEFIPETWNRLWGQFTAANPDNALSSMSAFDAWQSPDPSAQIQVMYAELNKWYAGYDQGLIAKSFNPGGKQYWRVQLLQQSGINVLNNFLEYAYLRHNTDPTQIVNITNKVFTPENLVATQYLVLTQAGQGTQGAGMCIPGQANDPNATYCKVYGPNGNVNLLYQNGTTYTYTDTYQQWSVPDWNGGTTTYTRDIYNPTANATYGDWATQHYLADGTIDTTGSVTPTVALTIMSGTGSGNAFLNGTGGLDAATIALDQATGQPFSLTNQAIDVALGNIKTFTVYADAARTVDQIITLALSGGASSAYMCTGANLISFANGPVNVTIPAGQDHVTVSLVNASNSSTPDNMTLTASLTDASGNITTSNNLVVTFDHPNPNAGNTYNNIGGTTLVDNTNGTTYTKFFTDGANDRIVGTSGRDSIEGSTLGDNLIIGNGGQDIIIAGNGNNQIYANTQVDLATALTQQRNITTQKGDVIGVGDGNNTIVGGDGNDDIFTGTGSNTLVLGNGANIVQGGVEASNAATNSSTTTTPVYPYNTSYNGISAGSAPFTAPANYLGNYYGPNPVGLGNDTIFGGTGNSVYWLSNGDNWLDAGGGNEAMYAVLFGRKKCEAANDAAYKILVGRSAV